MGTKVNRDLYSWNKEECIGVYVSCSTVKSTWNQQLKKCLTVHKICSLKLFSLYLFCRHECHEWHIDYIGILLLKNSDYDLKDKLLVKFVKLIIITVVIIIIIIIINNFVLTRDHNITKNKANALNTAK